MYGRYYINNRLTYRNELNLNGVLILNNDITADCSIINLSFNGFQVVFSDNSVLFNNIFSCSEDSCLVEVSFEYDLTKYIFKCDILWKKILDLFEEDYYVMVGLRVMIDEPSDKENMFQLLLNELCKKQYLGK